MPQLTPPTPEDEKIIRSFPAFSGLGTPGFVTDFLGTRTRVDFVSTLPARDGSVESYPIPDNFHATATEWAGVLRAVQDAQASLTVVELGAGWGPWLVAAAFAAKLRGINHVHLVGVEGAKAHWEYLRRHLTDNGLDPDRHTLLNAVVGIQDGTAWFPIPTDPASEYGATAAGAGLSSTEFGRGLVAQLKAQTVKVIRRFRGESPEGMVRVPCHSVRTILRELEVVDLMHVDIQGHEVDVLAHSEGTLESQVRRLVVGTHGRSIESRLHHILSARGWVLEADEACRLAQFQKHVYLVWDGCQVWRNRALLPNPPPAVN